MGKSTLYNIKNMENTTQIGILCFGIDSMVLIFVLLCARVVYNFAAFIRSINLDDDEAVPEVKRR